MPEPTSERIETPRIQRLADFKRRTLPVIVWSVAALIVVGMLAQRATRFEYIGLAQGLEYAISPNSPGTVDAVVVDLYDAVRPGDVVATLDDAPVLASIETANAMLAKLSADLEASRAMHARASGEGLADWTADLRRFQMDEEQRRLSALELSVVIESDEIESERLELELRRAEQLLEAGLLSRSDHDIQRLALQQVRERLELNRRLLQQTEEEYRAAQRRREEYQARLPELPGSGPVLGPLQAAIEVETARLREIQLLRESLVLRSPVSGQVTQILCRQGQSITAGEPVVRIAEDSVREIVTYLAQNDDKPVRTNMPVLLSSRNAGGAMAESVVLRVGSSIQPLPPRLWRDPRYPDYGRAVVIAATPTMRLTPGELVNVKFSSVD